MSVEFSKGFIAKKNNKKFLFALPLVFVIFLLCLVVIKGKNTEKTKTEEKNLFLVSNHAIASLVRHLLPEKYIVQTWRSKGCDHDLDFIENSKINEMNLSKALVRVSRKRDNLAERYLQRNGTKIMYISNSKDFIAKATNYMCMNLFSKNDKNHSLEDIDMKNTIFSTKNDICQTEKDLNIAMSFLDSDPHFWTSPVMSIYLMESFVNELTLFLREDEMSFVKRQMISLEKKLRDMDSIINKKFSKCKVPFFSIHNGYTYAYIFYNLNYLGTISKDIENGISNSKFLQMRNLIDNGQNICMIADENHFHKKSGVLDKIKRLYPNSISIQTVDVDSVTADYKLGLQGYENYIHMFYNNLETCLC